MHAAHASLGDGRQNSDTCSPSHPPGDRATEKAALSPEIPPTGRAPAAADAPDLGPTAGARPNLEGATPSTGDPVVAEGHPDTARRTHASERRAPTGNSEGVAIGSPHSRGAGAGGSQGAAAVGQAAAEPGRGELLRAAATVTGVGLAAAELRGALRAHFDGVVAVMSRLRVANEGLAEKCEAQAEQAAAVATFAKVRAACCVLWLVEAVTARRARMQIYAAECFCMHVDLTTVYISLV